ncbi:MAG: hypothetical protein JSS70_10370 [Bacteroidetes bacterium]|nr:hypothetical protein [Bacteroidota bacterium]
MSGHIYPRREFFLKINQSMRFFIILLIFISCSPAKPEYLQNVASFGRTTRQLSTAPGDLYQQISDFRHELRLVRASVLFNGDSVISTLNRLMIYKKSFEENVAVTYSACNIISTYAECLLSITDQRYVRANGIETADLGLKLNNVISGFSINKNAKLPKTVGSFLGMVVTEIGSARIEKLQKKYLKEFIDTGSVLINTISDYLVDVVGENLNLELPLLDQQFNDAMLQFYYNIEPYERKIEINHYDYLEKFNPLYLSMKERLENLHRLQQKTIIAMQNIKSAHAALQAAADGNTVSDSTEEMKKLYNSMMDVTAVMKKFKQDTTAFH